MTQKGATMKQSKTDTKAAPKAEKEKVQRQRKSGKKPTKPNQTPAPSAKQAPKAAAAPAPAPAPAPAAGGAPKKKGKGKKGKKFPYVLKKSDMDLKMKTFAISTAAEALQTYTIEKDISAFMVKAFDEAYGRQWQCLVGSNYAICVDYECGSFINIYSGQFSLILFRTKRMPVTCISKNEPYVNPCAEPKCKRPRKERANDHKCAS